jgi:hypothetical protein
MNAYERLLLPENLNYAWRKTKRLLSMADGYVDRGEVIEFEINLERHLQAIHEQFADGHFKLQKLRPLPRPKKMDADDPVDRQYFHVAVADQVAWIAVVNVLGPELDRLMPPWSYGNRIYRPAWYERVENRGSKLEIGPYRHASGYLYRKFQHSWPLFRRHVSLTARKMVRVEALEMDVADERATASAIAETLQYLRGSFWRYDERGKRDTDLYHAAIDLKQFYPSVRTDAVLRGLAMGCDEIDKDSPLREILEGMLRFELDQEGIPRATLRRVEPVFDFDKGNVEGIPTGLFVAGFLANAAMLPVDQAVDDRIRRQRALAHFRFVDDHTILAYDFDQLCEWIAWYEATLQQHNIGAVVNKEKYDPHSLSMWMRVREEAVASTKSLTSDLKKVKDEAVRDTKIDGANPTRLLTKTLGQVSVIAAADIEILDDDDLRERLKLLEWLLLADIPEREIRPDTRAAFAAGQIAALAPVLIQEGDNLVDEYRALAELRSRPPRADRATRKQIEAHEEAVARKTAVVEELLTNDRLEEEKRLRRCFHLLLQAFQEFPGKARLFYRLHQYCHITGHGGLSDIADWIRRMREQRNFGWADYYAGLSLQILSESLLHASRTLKRDDALRLDREAAWRHLKDIAKLNARIFFVPRSREAWFHSLAQKEFGVALTAAAEMLREQSFARSVCARFRRLSARYVQVNFGEPSRRWIEGTGWPLGVWAHWIESIASVDGRPSPVWQHVEQSFAYDTETDRNAARRYPELLSNRGWRYLLRPEVRHTISDAGWLRDVMNDNVKRIESAQASKNEALALAARSFSHVGSGWVTLSEWTNFVKEACSPFDPRRSEWTALEIIRQLVAPVVTDISTKASRLDRLHPNNILIREDWISNYAADRTRAAMNWEDWRLFVANDGAGAQAVKLRGARAAIFDYRYFTYTLEGQKLDPWERRLVAMGRLLLGQLCFDYGAPRLWNLRGNERVVILPRTRMLQTLAISSRTLLLVEGCLGVRSAETRAIPRGPELFGLTEGAEPNDADYDPPLLVGPNELLQAIEIAQRVLTENQLAVAMNQPRQLIPFRLSDFAAVLGPEEGEDGLAE